MKKYRIRKLSPLWWAEGIGMTLLIIVTVYIIAGAGASM